jgi:hypothetical protein
MSTANGAATREDLAISGKSALTKARFIVTPQKSDRCYGS